MKRGFKPWGIALLGALGLGLLGACDGEESGTAPPAYTPLTRSVELTVNLDAGAPVALAADGERLAIAYTCLFEGTGDIFRLVLDDADGDGLYEHFATIEEFPNDNDPSIFYTRSDHQQFTTIGSYEADNGEGGFPSDPGAIYFSGPRQLYYDVHSDRLFYAMGYGGTAQIASTVAPLDAQGEPFAEIVNSYDASLAGYSNTVGRPPIWDFWYTKTRVGANWRFTGGSHASVSPPMAGGTQWLAYADTLLSSYDHDGDGEIGEDSVGEVEVLAGGASDFAPGYIDVDDDNDGGIDFDDAQVAAMTVVNPAQYSFAWMLQNYLPAWDDDEDGLIDEDRLDVIDNDGDGLFDEDPRDPFDDDGDGVFDEDGIDGIDNDDDLLIDEDPYVGIDNDGDGLIDEDAPDRIDNDGDGLSDEDQPGDMNGDGFPGVPGDEPMDGGPGTGEDTLGDLQDPEVNYANFRALLKDDYDPLRDDDEDGISDEDADYARNGIWVVRIAADGLPDETATPISLTNDRGRQPFFNPTGSDLLYVQDGDIHRLSLDFTADAVTVTGSTNLTNSAALEAYPAYADDGGRIVFSSSEYGSADLFIREVDGTQTRVTNDPGQELYARFTPDGQQLLFEGWLFPAGVRRVMITIEPLP